MLTNKMSAKGKILFIFDIISIASVMQLMAPHNCMPHSVSEQQILIVYRKTNQCQSIFYRQHTVHTLT